MVCLTEPQTNKYAFKVKTCQGLIWYHWFLAGGISLETYAADGDIRGSGAWVGRESGATAAEQRS